MDFDEFFNRDKPVIFAFVVGFWEEHEAGNTMAALKAQLEISEKIWSSMPAHTQAAGRERPYFPSR